VVLRECRDGKTRNNYREQQKQLVSCELIQRKSSINALETLTFYDAQLPRKPSPSYQMSDQKRTYLL
jgi:hypothetical protein